MKRKMYEIQDDLQRALTLAEEVAELNDGVVAEEIANALKDVQMEREDKIEGVALYTKMLNGENDLIKKEIDRLSAIKKANENKVKGYREWLKMSLNCKNFKTVKTSVLFRRNKSVNIKNIEDMDCKYYQVKTEKVPDKKFIKWTIENIEDVAGAEIIESTSITVK